MSSKNCYYFFKVTKTFSVVKVDYETVYSFIGSIQPMAANTDVKNGSTWQHTWWCVRSGRWLVEWEYPWSCRHINSHHRRFKQGEALMVFKKHWTPTFNRDILTKNTAPSTFRARLPVTLAEWQFLFITKLFFSISIFPLNNVLLCLTHNSTYF